MIWRAGVRIWRGCGGRHRRRWGEVGVVLSGGVAGDWSADSHIDVFVISPNAPEDPWERARVAQVSSRRSVGVAGASHREAGVVAGLIREVSRRGGGAADCSTYAFFTNGRFMFIGIAQDCVGGGRRIIAAELRRTSGRIYIL